MARELEPGGDPVADARALYDSLHQVKGELQAVDAAVAEHLRTSGSPAKQSWLKTKIAVRSGVGVSIGIDLVLLDAHLWQDIDPRFRIPVVVAHGVFGAGAQVMHNRRDRRKAERRHQREVDDRCDDFLFRGVGVELALGDLRRAIAEATDGRPASAEELADKVTAAQEAFEDYFDALHRLREGDLSVPFPWSTVGHDIVVARELLALDAGTLLTQAGQVGAGTLDLTSISVGSARSGSNVGAPPNGGLADVITAADAFRAELITVNRDLDTVEFSVQKAPRKRGTAADVHSETLGLLAHAIREARFRAGLLHTDCVVIDTAARQAESARSAAQALPHLTVVPINDVRPTFESFASSLAKAADHLAAIASDARLDDAAAAAGRTMRKLPELADLCRALAATFETTYQGIREAAHG